MKRQHLASPGRILILASASAALGLAAPGTAQAASGAAWDEFRAAVETACTALVEAPAEAEIAIEVNPFGSESYGVALVTVSFPAGGADRMICVMDKKTGVAELSAPFLPEE